MFQFQTPSECLFSWITAGTICPQLSPPGYRLKESLACRVFIKECPWGQHLWKAGEKNQDWVAGEVKLYEGQMPAWTDPMGNSGL